MESWHGFSNNKSSEYTAETKEGSCANLVRAMAMAIEESDA